MQLREVGDVLARGQSLVQAARIGQHTEPAAHRERVARCIDAIDQTWPRSGFSSVYSMRSVVVLPAPLGPSRPVISPSRALKVTSCDRDLVPEGLVQLLDLDHGAAPLKSMNAGMRPSCCRQRVIERPRVKLLR